MVTTEETGLEVNAKKTKCTVMSREHHAGQDHNIKISNKSFERMEQLKYLETTLIDQSTIHEETESRLKEGIAC